MNSLTRKITTLLKPVAALIAYHNPEHYDTQYFLELRPIDARGRMREAMPVTMDFMNQLATSFSEAQSGVPHGVVPQNLLYADTRRGSERYVWYNPPRKRMMYFTKGLHIENGEYNLPGIIYAATHDKLDVYAYKGNTPTEKTKLYEAPFFNVTHGNVCLGNGQLDKPVAPTYEQLFDYWERRFFLTEFSHLGSSGNPTRTNLVLVTKAARECPFDLKELKPLNKTLNTLLQ